MKLLGFLAAVYLMSGACLEATGAALEVTEAEEPYLLISTRRGIGRLNMDGSGFEMIVLDTGVTAIDYHYRRDMLFWVTDFSADLKFTTLSNKTGNISSLNIMGMNPATGLAVDWINDLVYWVERSPRLIRVYNMNTKVISSVLVMDEPSSSKKLKILPHLGLLFVGDRGRNGIYRIPVGGSRQPIDVLGIQCPLAMALSYKTGNIYTMDSCSHYMKSSKIDGSDPETIMSDIGQGFVYGSSMFKDKLFWTQATATSYVKSLDMNTNITQNIYFKIGDIFNDIMVVHSSNQPTVSELEQYGLCKLVCHHGDCMQSGVCSCNEGWTGMECAADINECQDENGGCKKTCVNLPGSFQCGCEDGEELLPDQKGCKLAEPDSHTTLSSTPPTTTSIPPTTATHYPTTPFSNTEESTSTIEMPTTPHRTTEPPTTPLITTEIPTTTLSTTETPTTPLSTTETPTTPLSTTVTPTTPLSATETSTTTIRTTETPTTPISTTETPTTPISTTETPTKPLSTTDTQTTPHSTTEAMTTLPSNSDMDVTSHTDQDSSMEIATTPSRTTKSMTDQTTRRSEEISTTDTQKKDDATSLADDLTLNTPEDSLNIKFRKEKERKRLIVGVIISGAGFVIFVAVLLYTVFLYFKYKHNKTGTYNVYERQKSHGSHFRRQSEYENEPGTMSVHTSFRDVRIDFDHLNDHERVSRDVTELGCTETTQNVEGRPAVFLNVPMLGSRRERSDSNRELRCEVNSRLIDNCQTL